MRWHAFSLAVILGQSIAFVLRFTQPPAFSPSPAHPEICVRPVVTVVGPDTYQLTDWDRSVLGWLLGEQDDEQEKVQDGSLEFGPKWHTKSAWCSNAETVLRSCGLYWVERVEQSRRYQGHLLQSDLETLAGMLHDSMTEEEWSIDHWGRIDRDGQDEDRISKQPTSLPLLYGGADVLQMFSDSNGLGFSADDVELYERVFLHQLQRDPTDVEVFDLGQSNSEHCRHWFFNGKLSLEGELLPWTLMDLVRSTLERQIEKNGGTNSILAFCDNSSAIRGREVSTLVSSRPARPAPLHLVSDVRHPLLTAETHNFPSGVAPFPGAETGVGGRLRDIQATGRGAVTHGGVVGYCVGQLSALYAEERRAPADKRCTSLEYPPHLALPLDILVSASDGASDYANKFGEPLLAGFARAFRMDNQTRGGEGRVEWIKPIMFSAGIGSVAECHAIKGNAQEGMAVVKIGGPAYRIGLGGGAASSRSASAASGSDSDTNSNSALDVKAVQRGDAEMGNKLAKVVRACAEMGAENPIHSIHDQGAGGNANVIKELVAPVGAEVSASLFPLGDTSLTVLELWASEYQENHALLCQPHQLTALAEICHREGLPMAQVGVTTATGQLLVHGFASSDVESQPPTAVDLPLKAVLEGIPQRNYLLKVRGQGLLGDNLLRENALAGLLEEAGVVPLKTLVKKVFRLVAVGSKSFLTTKVDRSVGGLVASQPCCGPFHLPLANVGVTALSMDPQENIGCAVGVGECPPLTLLDPAAMARMAVGEMLTNMVWAQWSEGGRSDIKVSANWMWARPEGT
ncbi:unnamed protein product [Chrysoparadoxa australica]